MYYSCLFQTEQFCREQKHDDYNPDSTFCASSKSDKPSSKPGNSGGPFVMKYNNQWYVAGIVSHGPNQNPDTKTTYFTRVEYFYEWIVDTIKADGRL